MRALLQRTIDMIIDDEQIARDALIQWIQVRSLSVVLCWVTTDSDQPLMRAHV